MKHDLDKKAGQDLPKSLVPCQGSHADTSAIRPSCEALASNEHLLLSFVMVNLVKLLSSDAIKNPIGCLHVKDS